MASIMSLVKSGLGHMEMKPHAGGRIPKMGEVAVAEAGEMIVGGLVSYGIGRCYHRYGNKWCGKDLPKYVTGIGKAGSVLLAGFGFPVLGGILSTAGQSGWNAIMLETGLKHERAVSGKRVVALPKGAALPAGAEEVDAIGAGPRALSYDNIEEFHSMH